MYVCTYAFTVYQFTDLERIYVKRVLKNLDKVMGNEFFEEIHGIAEFWNIDVGIIVGMNIIPETRRVHRYVNFYTHTCVCIYTTVNDESLAWLKVGETE